MRKSIFNKILCVALILSSLSGCSSTNKYKSSKSKSLSDFQSLSSSSSNMDAVNSLRTQALRDTALSLGARAGLAHRAKEINQVLNKYENLLIKAINFNGMLVENNVLPPVLVEARKTLSLSGSDVIRVQERNYEIISQAKFVTAAPTFREYLWLSYTEPDEPDSSLLPKNKEEKIIWHKYIQQGWDAGIGQANIIFNENVSRLLRDFQGMILYRKLLAQNMVSRPFVASLDLGVTGNEHSLNINDRVLRITSFPSLQTDSSLWKTEIYKHE